MGIEILEGRDLGQACLTCNTTGVAFGPLFEDREEAEAFLAWCIDDPRSHTDRELGHRVSEFRSERADDALVGTA